MRMLRQAPIRPDQAPNSKYKVPMSLWFVENSQRVIYTGSMADIAADCKFVYGDSDTPATKPRGVITSDCKSEVGSPARGFSVFSLAKRRSRLMSVGLDV